MLLKMLSKLKEKVSRLIDKYVFGDIFSPPSVRDKKPLVYGGDAVSPETAATVNCYSMPVANRLIDRFISKQHGEKDVDWKRELEYFVNSPEITEFTIRAIGIVTTSGESHTYYFDVSQPMGASMNLIRVMSDENVSFPEKYLKVIKNKQLSKK